MKKQILKVRLWAFLVFVSIVFFACEQEDMDNTNESLKENRINEKTIHRFRGQSIEKIREAQKWLSNHSLATRSSEESILGWEYAFSDSTKTYETVEVPVGYLKQRCIVLPDAEEKYVETQNPKYLRNITRLVIETNKETGEKRSYYMTIVPSAKCIDQAADSLSLNTYLQRNKSFDGWILFSDLDNKRVNGWQYQDGKITAQLKPSDTVRTRASVVMCRTIYEVTSTDWYSNEEYIGTSVWVDEREECWLAYLTQDGGGRGGGGGIGGGGGTPSYDTAPEVDDKEMEGTKAGCIKDALEAGGNTSLINKLLKGFKLEGAPINLTYKVQDKVYNKDREEVNGLTKPTSDNEITIYISKTKMVDYSFLETARTILHETLHAHLYAMIAAENNEGYNTIADADGIDFKKTWREYIKLHPKKQQQHNWMADRYISLMKKSLSDLYEQWGEVNSVTKDRFENIYIDSEATRDFMFECIAWHGLLETEAGKKFYKEKGKEYKDMKKFTISAISKDCPF